MSYLKRFSQKESSKKDKQFTVKVPQSVYDQFVSLCNEYNLSVNHAINLLIERSIKEETEETAAASDPVQPYTSELTYISEHKPRRKRTNYNSTRFTLDPYALDGKVPCPICRNFVSQPNYSRHAKLHEKSSEELIVENLEIVNQMIEERKQLNPHT